MHSKLIIYFGFFSFFLSILTSCSGKKSQYADMIMESTSYTGSPLSNTYMLPDKGKVLTRERAIEIAMANNPNIAIAQLKSIAASAQYYGSFAALSPSVSVDRTGNSTVVYADANRWNAINAQMDILARKQNMLSSQEMSVNTQRLLALQTAIAYDSIISDKAEISIKIQNKAFYDQELQKLEETRHLTETRQADILQLKTQANEAQVSLIQSINKFNNDKTALAVLMGIPNAQMPKNIIFPETMNNIQDKEQSSVDTYLDRAIEQRPDLQAAKADARASEYELYASYAELTPASDALISSKSASASSEVNLNPLPEVTNIISAKASEGIADEELMQTYMQTQYNARSSYEAVSSSQAQEKIISEQQILAKENRDMIKTRYDAGLAGFDELNQAQNQYISTLLLYNRATINEAASKAALDAAVGLQGF